MFMSMATFAYVCYDVINFERFRWRKTFSHCPRCKRKTSWKLHDSFFLWPIFFSRNRWIIQDWKHLFAKLQSSKKTELSPNLSINPRNFSFHRWTKSFYIFAIFCLVFDRSALQFSWMIAMFFLIGRMLKNT